MEELDIILKGKKNLFFIGKTEEEKIRLAENVLGLQFAKVFYAYLLKYGVVTFSAHEFTGISDFKRLDVVPCTMEWREQHTDLPRDLYVIEKTNIDNAVILQNTDGTVFISQGEQLIQIADSFLRYLQEL